MGYKIAVLFCLLILLCLCIYNWWFLKERNKRRHTSQTRKQSFLENHTFWGAAALVILLGLLVFISVEIAILYTKVLEMQQQ